MWKTSHRIVLVLNCTAPYVHLVDRPPLVDRLPLDAHLDAPLQLHLDAPLDARIPLVAAQLRLADLANLLRDTIP